MPRRERRRSDHPNGNLNRILASLPASEMRRVERDLEPYELDSRAVLQDVDAPIRDVFFVETGVISVLAATVDGAAVEVATVGREGFVGLPVALGTDRAASQSVVQIPGAALRMPAAAFRRHFEAGGELQNLVHRYAQAIFTMLAQSSACNRMHSV